MALNNLQNKKYYNLLINSSYNFAEKNINGSKVKISNFGTFILRYKKSRIGRNPKTKKEAIISERNVILFKPSKFLKNRINNEN